MEQMETMIYGQSSAQWTGFVQQSWDTGLCSKERYGEPQHYPCQGTGSTCGTNLCWKQVKLQKKQRRSLPTKLVAFQAKSSSAKKLYSIQVQLSLLLLGATRTKTIVGPYPNFDRFKQIGKLPSLGKWMHEEEKMEENKKLNLEK